MQDVDSVLKKITGDLKSMLPQGVWFKAYSTRGDLDVIIVDENQNAKIYEFYSVGGETIEEFQRKLKYDRQHGGKGYDVLRWLENLYGKGEPKEE